MYKSINGCLHTCWHESKRQMARGRQSHADEKADRQRDRQICWLVDMDIPLFSMAWIRLTRTGGAVSGGVNCSLRSATETAETTTQITVTLLARGPAALTEAQLTRSSWWYRAWVQIKRRGSAGVYRLVDVARNTSVLHKERENFVFCAARVWTATN